MPAATSNMLPTTQRPLPLRARTDIVAKRIEYRSEGTWVLKDPVALTYHRLLGEQYGIWQLLNGSRSVEDIKRDLQIKFPTLNISVREIQQVITDLHQKQLLLTDRPGQADVLLKQRRDKRKQQFQKALQSLLYLRLPGWDPETTLTWLYPFVRFMFRPWAVAASLLLVISAWVLLAVQFDVFHRALPEFDQFFGWPNLIYLWITLAAAKIVHEFGHGLTCKHFGGECHEMGLMLLVFSPCLYCDVTDSWMMENKWKRIMIAAAGMYIEIILSAIAIFVWWNTTSGLLHHLCLNVFFVTTVTTVIFNANPLMRFDGYYILSDWLEIPNLRPKADQLLRERFSWHCLGIESPPDPFMPQSGRAWFVAFALAASIYRWVVFFGIMLFLYTVLKPYGLQSLGITLAFISIAGLLYSMGHNIWRIVMAPRMEPISRKRLSICLTVALGVMAIALLVPLPLHVESPFLVEPVNANRVFVVTPGRLVDVPVKPGQYVTKGTLLARLENVDKQDEKRKLLLEQEVQKARIELSHTLDDQPQAELAAVELNSIEKRLEELEQQLQQLDLHSEVDGWIVAPPFRQQPPQGNAGEPLHKWFGTPLEKRNRGAYLESGTELLSIAPQKDYEAVVLVDQADRNDIAVGQNLELRFEHLARKSYHTNVTKIAERHLEFAPKELSKNAGGELTTVADVQGRERLTSYAFQATAKLTKDVELFRSGMQGRARFRIEQRSTASWIWRYLRQTFRFRL